MNGLHAPNIKTGQLKGQKRLVTLTLAFEVKVLKAALKMFTFGSRKMLGIFQKRQVVVNELTGDVVSQPGKCFINITARFNAVLGSRNTACR